MTGQTSASDRYAAARAALAEYDEYQGGFTHPPINRFAEDLAAALRALITPPGVHESESEIAYRLYPQVLAEASRTQSGEPGVGPAVSIALRKGINAGIQSAHETWEPEVAQRPTQEQMLRWLGIVHSWHQGSDKIRMSEQIIERED